MRDTLCAAPRNRPRLSMHELSFSPFLVPCPLCLSYSHFLRAIPSLSLAHFFPSVFRSLSVAYSECCPFRRLVKWTIFDSSVLGVDEERRRLDSSREEDVFKTKRDKILRACEERYVSLMRIVKWRRRNHRGYETRVRFLRPRSTPPWISFRQSKID